MGNCSFLSNYEDQVQCFKECPLYKWEENSNTCPFVEMKNEGSLSKVTNFYDIDLYKDERECSISNLY